MNVVAAEASNSPPVHQALHEVVALHAILVSRPIGKMRERCLTQLVLFELPKVLQMKSDVISNRPVVVFALNRTR